MRYMDNVVAPSLAMLASNRLAAPRFVGQDPDELRVQLDRIPLPERRAAWEKLMFQSTAGEELVEFERRLTDAVGRFAAILGRQQWLVGEAFSLADTPRLRDFLRPVAVALRPRQRQRDAGTHAAAAPLP